MVPQSVFMVKKRVREWSKKAVSISFNIVDFSVVVQQKLINSCYGSTGFIVDFWLNACWCRNSFRYCKQLTLFMFAALFLFSQSSKLASMQYLHLPQSDLVHPGQEPHLFLFTPTYVQMEVWHEEKEFYSAHPAYSKSYGLTGLLYLPSFCLYFTCYDKQRIEWHFKHITFSFKPGLTPLLNSIQVSSVWNNTWVLYISCCFLTRSMYLMWSVCNHGIIYKYHRLWFYLQNSFLGCYDQLCWMLKLSWIKLWLMKL